MIILIVEVVQSMLWVLCVFRGIHLIIQIYLIYKFQKMAVEGYECNSY